LNIADKKWGEISLDFVEGLPKSHGKDVILVVVDRLTNYAHFLAKSHPYSVHKVAQLFIDNIFKLHGMPTIMVSDTDRIFTIKLWQEVFATLNVDLHFSTAYHPESDGQTERVNQQCLEQYLRSMSFKAPKKWIEWLSTAEWWYNSSYHSTIKTSPFEALYMVTLHPKYSLETQEALMTREQMIKSLRQNLAYAQHKMKKFADRKKLPGHSR
jgi:hypothetical protein